MPNNYVIPARSRVRISQRLSYPIGAEILSQELAPVPQLHEIALHFYSFHAAQLSLSGEVIRVEYLNAEPANGGYLDLHLRPQRSRWELVVQPVLRKDRRVTQTQIREFALPRIARWLEERASLTGKGNDILAFFHFGGDLVEDRLSNMNPPRIPPKRHLDATKR